ncbi:MAG: M48 family metalloprotease, partial [Kiritimatiellae bacterium]|nr:M48 family metalloprotease [Kiritimatiellia bacterium]
SEWLMENQNPNETISADGTLAAKRGFSESENDVALASMRGFSESENGEMAAMRGAAGSGKAAAKADPAAVTKVLAERKAVSDAEVAAFISAGGLAKSDLRQLKEEKVEEEGFFGGFMKKTRKVGSGGLGFASKLAGSVAGDDKLIGAAASAGKITSGLIYSEVGPVQEYQLGCVVASRILPIYRPLPQDDPRSVYVRMLGATLAAASNDPIPYHGYMFLTVDSNVVNAFAVPGGFVFVTTGMLKFLKDEDELAAILGHEMGHMELRHGMKSVGKESVLKLFSLMKEVATMSGDSGDSTQTAARQQLVALADELFGKLTTSIRNGYGIEMESQADWRSIQFAKALGYETKALYDVLERFKAEKGTYGGASYPAERGADVLKYREGFGCKDSDGESGRAARAARYRSAVGD